MSLFASHKAHGSVHFTSASPLALWTVGPFLAAVKDGVKLMKLVKTAVMAAVLGLPLAAPALALEPINKNAHINSVLLQGFIADAMTDNCPTLRPRRMAALHELTKLRDYALKQGYKAAEIRGFVENKTEKARGKAEAAAWLKANGAVPGKAQAYCALGETEIAKKSLIGRLLRSTK